MIGWLRPIFSGLWLKCLQNSCLCILSSFPKVTYVGSTHIACYSNLQKALEGSTLVVIVWLYDAVNIFSVSGNWGLRQPATVDKEHRLEIFLLNFNFVYVGNTTILFQNILSPKIKKCRCRSIGIQHVSCSA